MQSKTRRQFVSLGILGVYRFPTRPGKPEKNESTPGKPGNIIEF